MHLGVMGGLVAHVLDEMCVAVTVLLILGSMDGPLVSLYLRLHRFFFFGG